MVAQVEVQHAVGDHDDGPAAVREQPQLPHDLLVQGRIQTRGGLVQGEQRRLGEQLQRHRGALALPAGEGVDPLLAAVGQAEQLDHLGDALPALLARHVTGEAQRGREAQCPADGELAVQHVVLGHHADAVTQLRIVLVEVFRVVEQFAAGRLPEPGHALEQGGLAAAARPDHAE